MSNSTPNFALAVALPLYKKYTDLFLMDDVPEAERKAVARQVADSILAMLKEENKPLKSQG